MIIKRAPIQAISISRSLAGFSWQDCTSQMECN
jgi:hypothetical protein